MQLGSVRARARPACAERSCCSLSRATAAAGAAALLALMLCSATAWGASAAAAAAQQQQGSSSSGNPARHQRYVRSEDMGISRCTLQGSINGGKEDVLLHLWLRMLPPPPARTNASREHPSSGGGAGQQDAAATARGDSGGPHQQQQPPSGSASVVALVRGFAHLQSLHNSIPKDNKGSPQLLQAPSIKNFTADVYLRSPYTKHNYPLRVTLRGLPPSEATAQLGASALTHVMDVWGALQLLPQDRKALDFELRVEGFSWYCPFYPQPGFNSTGALPVHQGVQAAFAAALAANAAAGGNLTGSWSSAAAANGTSAERPDGGGDDNSRKRAESAGKRQARAGRSAASAAEDAAAAAAERERDDAHLVVGSGAQDKAAPGGWHARRRHLDLASQLGLLGPERTDARQPQPGADSAASSGSADLGESAGARVLAAQRQSRWLDDRAPQEEEEAAAPPPAAVLREAAAMMRALGAVGDGGAAPAGSSKAAGQVDAALGAAEREVWVVLGPFYRLPLLKYTTLLWHHVLWHEQLGVQRYLLYVHERLGGFLQNPLIEALVGSGVLTVVHYTDMSKHESGPYYASHTDDYLMQVLLTNHALLALWGSQALALVVDIDEYLATPQPATALQVYDECADLDADVSTPEAPQDPPSNAAQQQQQQRMQPRRHAARRLQKQQRRRRRQQEGQADGAAAAQSSSSSSSSSSPAVVKAGLQIPRRDAACRPDAPDALCAPMSCYRHTWYNASPLAVGQGRTPHPMAWLTMNADLKQAKAYQDTKTFVDPNLVLDAHVHVAGALPGAMQLPARPSCARLVHLKDLFRWRQKKSRVDIMSAEATDHWWWPAQALRRRGEPERASDGGGGDGREMPRERAGRGASPFATAVAA